MVSSSKLTSTGSDRTIELAECGWRYETITQPDACEILAFLERR